MPIHSMEINEQVGNNNTIIEIWNMNTKSY